MKSLRIMVVDDDPAIVELFGDYLRMQGAQVETAGSTEKASALLPDRGFDLLVVDYLPGALQLIKQFRAALPSSAIVVLTGSTDDKQENEAMRVGASLVLHKPIGLPKLWEVITTTLHRTA
jgi:DNA-binding response OmpR family regulator